MKKKIKTNTGFKGITKRSNTGNYEIRVNVKNNSKSINFYIGMKKTLPEAVIERNNFIKNLI